MYEEGSFKEFKRFHPVVNFIYFLAVIAFSMFFVHPVSLIISIVCATAYLILLRGMKAVWKSFMFLLPVIAVTTLINPIFNHSGETVIAYLPNKSPITMEALLYGLAAGTMLAAAVCWFSCFNEIITTDKIVYLFGKTAPSFSLVLSMTLRFVPRFKEQLTEVIKVQKGLGKDVFEGKLKNRLTSAVDILSIMLTWSLEGAMDTADSMKNRGYGTEKRAFYSIYKFELRDKIILIMIIIIVIYILVSLMFGGMGFSYFPTIEYKDVGAYEASVFIAYFALLAMPTAIEIWEAIKWR